MLLAVAIAFVPAAIVGVVAASRVKFGDWLSFAVPIYLLLLVFSAIAIAVAVVTGL